MSDMYYKGKEEEKYVCAAQCTWALPKNKSDDRSGGDRFMAQV